MKMLSDMLLVEKNVMLFFEQKGYENINTIINTQRAHNDIIFICFKIYARIAADKNNCKKLHSSGVVSRAFRSFADQAFSSEVLVEFFMFALRLSSIDEASCFICEKGSDSIIESLFMHITSPKVIQNGAVNFIFD